MWAFALAASGALVAVYFANPFVPGGLLPPGPLHALTGLWCPGCGTTRAIHALLHGHLALALSMNPLAVLSLPLLPVIVYLNGPHAAARGPLARLLCSPRAWAVLLVAYGVLRNLPWPPFSWLAPGGWQV